MLISMCLKSPVDAILKVLFRVTSSHAHSISLLLVCSFFHSQSAAVTHTSAQISWAPCLQSSSQKTPWLHGQSWDLLHFGH